MEPGGKRSSSPGTRIGFRHGGPGEGQQLLRAAARGLLVLLPLVLPFEEPLFHVGPLLVTTAELALYLVLAAGGGALLLALAAGERSSERPRVRETLASPLAGGAAVWLATLFVCALGASTHRGAVLKF